MLVSPRLGAGTNLNCCPCHTLLPALSNAEICHSFSHNIALLVYRSYMSVPVRCCSPCPPYIYIYKYVYPCPTPTPSFYIERICLSFLHALSLLVQCTNMFYLVPRSRPPCLSLVYVCPCSTLLPSLSIAHIFLSLLHAAALLVFHGYKFVLVARCCSLCLSWFNVCRCRTLLLSLFIVNICLSLSHATALLV